MDNSFQTRSNRFGRAVMVAVMLILLATMIVCGGLEPAVDVDATVAAGIAATRQAEIDLQATVGAAIAATQTASQPAGDQLPEPTAAATPIPPSPSAPQPTPVPAPQQVRTVILNEVNGTVARDLTLLKSLYAPNAVVVDHHGTPDDPGDDTTWNGWANIERRYQAFFSAGYSALTLVDLSIQVTGNQATGTHQGVVLDGITFPDTGIYTLEKLDGQWLITGLEYGNEAGYVSTGTGEEGPAEPPARDDGLYILELGSQHRYEEPWGGDRGDPCKAWETGNFDDTQPNYRGFNVELLLTNNSDSKVPDAWPISFTTAKGKSVKACYYGYEGAGPPPGATSSVTFFTVVEKGDFVEKITFGLNGQTIRLCLDGKGGWSRC